MKHFESLNSLGYVTEAINTLAINKSDISSSQENETPKEIEAYIDSFIPEGFKVSKETRGSIKKLIESRVKLETDYSEKLASSIESFNSKLQTENLPDFTGDIEDPEVNESLLRFCQNLTDQQPREDTKQIIRFNEETKNFDYFVINLQGKEIPQDAVLIELANILIHSNVDLNQLGQKRFREIASKTTEEFMFIRHKRYVARNNELMFKKELLRNLESDFMDGMQEPIETLSKTDDPERIKQGFGKYFETYSKLKNHEVWGNTQTEYALDVAKILSASIIDMSAVRENLSEEQRHAVLEMIKESFDLLFDGQMGKIMTNRYTSVSEYIKLVLKLNKEEKQEIHRENWKEVTKELNEIKNRGELTVEDLETLQEKSLRHLAAPENLGLRTQAWEYAKVKKARGLSGENVPGATKGWIKAANELAQTNKPDILVYAELGSLYADFIEIHPLSDGNGTVAVFAIEAISAIRGGEVPESFEMNYNERVKKALHNNWAGLALANARVRLFAEKGWGTYKYNKAEKVEQAE